MGLKEKLAARSKTNFAIEPADILDWDGLDLERLYVREMSAKDSDAYERDRVKISATQGPDGKPKVSSESNTTNIRARLLVKTLCDAAGVKVYSDDDADAVGEMLPRNDADKLFDQANRINKLGVKEDADPAKNDSATTSASPTASPSPSGSGTSTA